MGKWIDHANYGHTIPWDWVDMLEEMLKDLWVQHLFSETYQKGCGCLGVYHSGFAACSVGCTSDGGVSSHGISPYDSMQNESPIDGVGSSLNPFAGVTCFRGACHRKVPRALKFGYHQIQWIWRVGPYCTDTSNNNIYTHVNI